MAKSILEYIEADSFRVKDAESKLQALIQNKAPDSQISEMQRILSERQRENPVKLRRKRLPPSVVEQLIPEFPIYDEEVSLAEALKSERNKTDFLFGATKKVKSVAGKEVPKASMFSKIFNKRTGKVAQIAATQIGVNLLFPGNFWTNLASSGGFEAGLQYGNHIKAPGWKKYALGFAGVAAVNVGAKIFGKDDAYNTIEGLHPGGSGLGAMMLRSNSEFGSGYRGMTDLPTSLMGVGIDPRILAFRRDVLNDPGEKAALEARLKDIQASAKENMGSFNESDYIQSDLTGIQGLVNTQNLREVNLSDFKLTVEDADTLILNRKGIRGIFSDPITVRSSGIDAPETAGHSDDPMEEVRIWQSQPMGEESTEKLRQLIDEQKDLRLIVDAKNQTYGRSLGILSGDNGRNLNLEQVARGDVAALPFGKSSSDIIDRNLVDVAQRKAQAHKEGIWGLSRYQAIAKATEQIGQPITYNSFTEINRLGKNLSFGAYGSFIEGLGDEQRDITYQEGRTAEKLGRALRKAFGPRRWSGKDDAYNTIEGLKHGGMAEQVRRSNSDFGSGWDSARALAKSIYKDMSEHKAFKMLRQSDDWKNMLTGAKELNELSHGVFGTTYLMEGQFKGEAFKFIKKTPKNSFGEAFMQKGDQLVKVTDQMRKDALAHEYSVMPIMENRIAPSPYGFDEKTESLFMELMPGKTIHQLTKEGTKLPTQDILRKISREAKIASRYGIGNADIHSGNVMFDEATNRVSWIDWGLAKSFSESSRPTSDKALKAMRNSIRKQLTPQLESRPRDILKNDSAAFNFSGFDNTAATPNERFPKTIRFEDDKTFLAEKSFSKTKPANLRKIANQQIQNSFQSAKTGARRHARFASVGN